MFSWHALIFAVIGRNTINITEIFQVFRVCRFESNINRQLTRLSNSGQNSPFSCIRSARNGRNTTRPACTINTHSAQALHSMLFFKNHVGSLCPFWVDKVGWRGQCCQINYVNQWCDLLNWGNVLLQQA